MGYSPRSDLEQKLFPNLGRALVTGGIHRYIGREGTVIEGNHRAARIAFDNFWDRPDGMSAVEADDATWVYPDEYQRI